MEFEHRKTEGGGCCSRTEGMQMALIAKRKFGSIDNQ